LLKLITAVNAQIPTAAPADCDPSSIAWAVEAVLNDGTRFCVDSTGFAGTRGTAKGATGTVCAAS